MKTSIASAATVSFAFLSIIHHVQVEAKPGFVVAKKPDDDTKFRHLADAYKKWNRTIDYKNQDEWDMMRSCDFQQYDAVIVLGNETYCPTSDPTSSYYDPFSNYIAWGNAVQHGNAIILATQELELMDVGSFDIIDAAVKFSLHNPSETGAIISLGSTYHNCDGLTAEWLNTAFGLTSSDDKVFKIVKNSNGNEDNMVVGSHPALQDLTDKDFQGREGRSTSMAKFVSYPDEFVPFVAVVESENNRNPFILLWEGNLALGGSTGNVSTKGPTVECTSHPSGHPSQYNHTPSPSTYKRSHAPSSARSLRPTIRIWSQTTKSPTISPSSDRGSVFASSPSHSPKQSNLPSFEPSISSMIDFIVVQHTAKIMSPCKESKSSKSRLCIKKQNKVWKSKSKSPKLSKKSRKSR